MGSVDWKIVIFASLGGVIGATAGTIFMQKKLNSNTVKKILAIILLIMAAKLLINII